MLDALLARHGLAQARVMHIASLDCSVWRVAPPGGAPHVCLRIYPADRSEPEPLDQELRWLHALAATGLHVPRPLPDGEGQWRMTLATHDGQPARHAALLTWLPGRMLYGSLRPVHLRRVGTLVAALHREADRLSAAGQLRPIRHAHAADLAAWAGQRTLPPGFPTGLLDMARQTAAELQARAAQWPTDATHCGHVHGDLHPWNLLFHGGQAGAIDFSDGGWGRKAQDLASVLQFLAHPLTEADTHLREACPALRDALFEGYARVQPLSPTLLAEVQPLIAARLLNTLQWIVDDWPSPDHRAWGPRYLSQLGTALRSTLA